MPTNYENAIFSSQAYEPAGGTPPIGWQKFQSSDEANFSLDGYFGQAYINNTTQEIVIAHRGTEPTDLLDLATDIILSLDVLPTQAIHASNFRDAVAGLADNNSLSNYTITHTGHSLGGALSQVMAAIYNERTTAFDSPGAQEIIDDANLTINPALVTLYNTAPNLFNTTNTQIVDVIRLYPDLPEDSILNNNYLRFWYG